MRECEAVCGVRECEGVGAADLRVTGCQGRCLHVWRGEGGRGGGEQGVRVDEGGW